MKNIIATHRTTHPYTMFVYGTLKSMHGNHRFMAGAIPLGRATTVEPYVLHSGGVPVARLAVRGDKNTGFLRGEVYMIRPEALPPIDRLEGNGYSYTREERPVQLDGYNEQITAWIYDYPIPAGYAGDAPDANGLLEWGITGLRHGW